MKKVLLIHLLLGALATKGQQPMEQKEWENTWTYTYLKAKEEQRENLKQFVIKNWFAMDSIAVRKGLFNDYRLLENQDQSTDAEWDYIVAVEYYTKGGYADIQAEWQEVRKNHTTVLIDGYSFPELGGVIKSETLALNPESSTKDCDGPGKAVVKPFLGQWLEFEEGNEKEGPYGKLSITLSAAGCALQKKFSMLTSPFSYTTLGYYEATSENWVETYTFSNGGYAVYEWKVIGDEVVLELTKSSFMNKERKRNRWTNMTADSFQIIAETSNDNGATWQVASTTTMRRIGG